MTAAGARRPWTVSTYLPRSPGAGRPRKLSDEQVREMTRRHRTGWKVTVLAREYQVSVGVVRRELKLPGRTYSTCPRVVPPDQQEQMKRDFISGVRPIDLAAEYRVSYSTVRRVIGLAKDSSY